MLQKSFWIALFLLIISLGLLIFLLIDRAREKRAVKDLLSSIEVSNKALIKKQINDTVATYSQALAVMTEKQAKETGMFQKLSDLSEKITKLESQVTLKIESSIKGLKLPVNKTDTFRIVESDTVPMLGEFNYSDRWVHLKGFQSLNNVYFDEIGFKDSISITIADFKNKKLKNLFKRPEYKLKIETTSPYTNITNSSNVFIKPNPKHWHITISAGAVWSPTHPLEVQPGLMFGVSRSLLSF